MLQLRCGLGPGLRSTRRLLFTSSPREVYEIVDARQTPTSGVAITSRIKKLNFPPFIKDIFQGKFNKSMLNYAEVLNYERHRALGHRINQINEYLDERSSPVLGVSGEISADVLYWAKVSRLSGLQGPVGSGGEDLLVTEVARIYEALGREPSLSEHFFWTGLASRVIMEHGTAWLTENYSSSLSSGDLIPTLCFTEPAAGSDLRSIENLAKFDPDSETYHLKGLNTWVPVAAKADLFVVLAKTQNKNYMGEMETGLTAFLVDREAGGVSVSDPSPVTAFSGVGFAQVEFNCKVPKRNIIGELGDGGRILTDMVNQNKFLASAGIVTSLRSLLDMTIDHCISQKRYGLHLSEFALVKADIAKMTGRLYCLESMIYLTAGLYDITEYPDIEVESNIVKQYTADTSDFIVKTCCSLLGSKAITEDSPALAFLKQNQFLRNYHGSTNVLKTQIAVNGIMYLCQHAGTEIMKKTSGFNLIKSSKWLFYTSQHKRDKVPQVHKLSDCVHPRLITTADKLEWVVEKIPFIATEQVLKHGDFKFPETDLVKLADIVIETYAMTCALSRANRSYIVGNLHGEHEIEIAIPYINDTRLKCRQLFLELLNWEEEEEDRRDSNWVQAGFFLADQKKYEFSHPLTRIPADKIKQENMSNKKKAPIMTTSNSNTIQIKDLKPGMNNLHLTFIVIEIGRPTTTKENQEVRTVKVADRSGMVNLSLWNEPGKVLQQGDIVRMTRGYTGMFKNCLTIYTAKHGEFLKIGDFCMIFSETPNMSEANPEMAAAFEKEEAEKKAKMNERNNSRGNLGNGGGSSNGGGGNKTWGSSGGGGGGDPRKRSKDNR